MNNVLRFSAEHVVYSKLCVTPPCFLPLGINSTLLDLARAYTCPEIVRMRARMEPPASLKKYPTKPQRPISQYYTYDNYSKLCEPDKYDTKTFANPFD